jgi:hypothetical protein
VTFVLKYWKYIVGALVIIVAIIAWQAHGEARYKEGIAYQQAQDNAATAKLKAAADAETARLQQRANTAEHIHDDELAELDRYRTAQPLHGGLCNDTHSRSGGVPKAGAANGSNESAGTGATIIQSLPSGNTTASGSGNADIRHLLDVLAGKADAVSAQLREYQAR